MVHAANLKLVQSPNKENVFVFYCICCCCFGGLIELVGEAILFRRFVQELLDFNQCYGNILYPFLWGRNHHACIMATFFCCCCISSLHLSLSSLCLLFKGKSIHFVQFENNSSHYFQLTAVHNVGELNE